MPAAAWGSIGTGAAGTTGAVTPTIGTHAIGNLMLLVAEADNTAWGADPAGWTLKVDIVGSGNKFRMWERVATSATENADHPPTLGAPTGGNHVYANVVVLNGQHATLPYHQIIQVWHGGVGTVAGSAGLDTKIDDVLFLSILGYGADNAGNIATAEANTGVTGLTERLDEGTINGNGGGLIIYSGTIPAPATIPATSWTAGTSTHFAGVVLAIAPAASYTIAGNVTVDGSPAPNGKSVRVLDLTQPAAQDLCAPTTTSGGTGAFSIAAPYNDHDYQVVYEDSVTPKFGASAKGLAV